MALLNHASGESIKKEKKSVTVVPALSLHQVSTVILGIFTSNLILQNW